MKYRIEQHPDYENSRAVIKQGTRQRVAVFTRFPDERCALRICSGVTFDDGNDLRAIANLFDEFNRNSAG